MLSINPSRQPSAAARRIALTRATALALACGLVVGCGPARSRFPAEAAKAQAGCSAKASHDWQRGSEAFSIEALSDGPDCARAAVLLTIRNAQGQLVWSENYDIRYNFGLQGAADASAMKKTLADWIDQTTPDFKTSADLPAWAKDAPQPVSGEFPFYVEEGIDRDAYLALQAQKLPILCYVQGMESMACLALKDGAFEKVGAQSFPG